MFCDEKILKVYMGVVEDDDVYSRHAFLDCHHGISYHCTDGYRLVLETAHYAISLSCKGIIKEGKNSLKEAPGEWLQEGIKIIGEDEPPWVHFETTFFAGERIVSTTQQDNIYLVQFDDFILKLIPHSDCRDIEEMRNNIYGAYHPVLGCERHLKKVCPHCGGEGEILLDPVGDHLVRCKNCGRSTYAAMTLIEAITDWNDSSLPFDPSN